MLKKCSCRLINVLPIFLSLLSKKILCDLSRTEKSDSYCFFLLFLASKFFKSITFKMFYSTSLELKKSYIYRFLLDILASKLYFRFQGKNTPKLSVAKLFGRQNGKKTVPDNLVGLFTEGRPLWYLAVKLFRGQGLSEWYSKFSCFHTMFFKTIRTHERQLQDS